MSPRRGIRWLSAGVSVVVLAAVLAGLSVLGSPMHQRALRLDTIRTSNLGQLAIGISGYWAAHKALPPTLESIDPSDSHHRDPVSGQPYGYGLVDATTYRLCAQFDTASEQESYRAGAFIPPNLGRWKHPQGMHCFVTDVRQAGAGIY
ncbi:hypothetical protein [Dyella sp. C9]|uniref:hypothetical protein n=1 Tax=Dyella sp. C9 TaxID=2202154 RepID=UPI000DEF75E6|nr:hypothetical protein [Dyella sp. C9]